MTEEKAFLTESNVYVSNARIVIAGTTYALSNITSVSKRMTPASTGCSTVIILFGVIILLIGLVHFGVRHVITGLVLIIIAVLAAGGGVYSFKSQKPTYHILLASSSGETEALSSQDEAVVDRIVNAINQAIVSRG